MQSNKKRDQFDWLTKFIKGKAAAAQTKKSMKKLVQNVSGIRFYILIHNYRFSRNSTS